MKTVPGTTLVATDDVRDFLISKGFTRDDGEPFAYVGYGSRPEILVVCEDSYWQDVNFLIQDARNVGAKKIAAALETLRQELVGSQQPPPP